MGRPGVWGAQRQGKVGGGAGESRSEEEQLAEQVFSSNFGHQLKTIHHHNFLKTLHHRAFFVWF